MRPPPFMGTCPSRTSEQQWQVAVHTMVAQGPFTENSLQAQPCAKESMCCFIKSFQLPNDVLKVLRINTFIILIFQSRKLKLEKFK